VSFLVLDEADEMLNAGFEPQINKALLEVRGDRQTVMTSATWPASVRRMAQNYTENLLLVVVGTTDVRAVTTVKQNIVFLDKNEARFEWVST
jgi:superfamily II DNA/RNA helicase